MADEQTQENKQQEVKKEEPTPTTRDANEGSEPQTANLIERANSAAERLEKANEKQEQLIKQARELQAYERLGGTTQGRPQETEPKEETPQEYAKRVMTGELKKE